MKKIIVLIIIFSLLSIMLSGCIEDDGNENENLKINRNTKFSLKSVNNNNFINEPLFLNLSIENIGNVDMKLNEFNIKNIFFILDISPVYNCGEDSYTISSKNDNKINGHTWDTNNKSILEKNNDLYIKINLNEVIFYYPQSSRNNSYVWNTFEKFLEDSYWISWINVYCNIKAYFIPEKDISNTIVSNNENLDMKKIFKEIPIHMKKNRL